MKASGILLSSLVLLGAAANLQSQEWLDRLPTSLLPVSPPSARVSGMPGELRIEQSSCNVLPSEGVRRRIVNTAVQEWAFFGFGVQDQTVERERGDWRRGRRIGPDLLTDDLNQRSDEDLLPIALSVGGYWSATPDGRWMLERQNETWQGEWGYRSDWRDFWSAAFISWVMCESGLGTKDQFERSIAHHDYIDQAIRARDGVAPNAAYVAYNPGEAELLVGDMLCRASRPDYETIEARRAHLDEGARSHCDIVVKLDEEAGEILAIGGNVSDSVRLKRLPAAYGSNGNFQPLPYNGRRIFAHLKLRVDEPIETNALDNSPTMLAASCVAPIGMQIAAAGIPVPTDVSC